MTVNGFVDMYNLSELLKEDSTITDCEQAKPLCIDNAKGASVEFRNVKFRYKIEEKNKFNEELKDTEVSIKVEDEQKLTLDNVSFKINSGESCAIVGHTGSGKSTSIRLLYRFYEIDGGNIFIENEDISKVTQKSLRKNMGIVPQDTVLFNDTLIYNLTYGSYFIRSTAELESKPEIKTIVEKACEQAKLTEFLSRQQEGYNSHVGERGLRLSGGEKQRVSIARCILRDPKIILFDEATSSLDSITEQEIKLAMDSLTNRTRIIIAHRLSTIKNVDQIVVLDMGRVVEIGTHE
eukprot:CAMPEP_0116951250 /NCGR_PEP_ID=MMETSP0467-20121206/39997_1 /TAXON_ID=283647 /ORGANISM="Mesodinium pulex, Strain SPMC105" /LENGTH=292 /DNA_ID=CAMNT_0004636239 /DNA_START=962 /DNA_END=1840 /DNA_ORIENTATION=-